MADFDREPIFWTSTRPGYNKRDRERVSFVDGEQRVERVPQRGHQGDYENRRPARGVRSVRVVRHEGHIIEMVVTNGAAHLDPHTEWGQYQFAKARFHGWFQLGSCPLARVAAGELSPSHFRAQSILKDRPCAPGTCSEKEPCKHALAEIEARRAAQAKANAELERKYAGAAERQIEAQREQTAALVEALTSALGPKEPAK